MTGIYRRLQWFFLRYAAAVVLSSKVHHSDYVLSVVLLPSFKTDTSLSSMKRVKALCQCTVLAAIFMGHPVEYMVCLVSNVQTLAEEKGKGCNAVKSAPSSHLSKDRQTHRQTDERTDDRALSSANARLDSDQDYILYSNTTT